MAAMKLKGYVLLESMIAMIIVMMCFGFSVMIYTTVMTGTRSKLKVLARIRMQNEAIKAKKENRLLDETIEYDEFRIEKRIVAFENSEDLLLLNYKAIAPDGILLGQYKEIIHAP
jgi:hypothetical protein